MEERFFQRIIAVGNYYESISERFDVATAVNKTFETLTNAKKNKCNYDLQRFFPL